MRMFQVCVCGQPLQLNEQPTPEPKGTEVLLKVLAAGVCHSDLHLADGWFDLGGGKANEPCRARYEASGDARPRKRR
jgi:D-arabinose 1-dehydrogenase-like Zn-dependent alcohol dehydrogenase